MANIGLFYGTTTGKKVRVWLALASISTNESGVIGSW